MRAFPIGESHPLSISSFLPQQFQHLRRPDFWPPQVRNSTFEELRPELRLPDRADDG